MSEATQPTARAMDPAMRSALWALYQRALQRLQEREGATPGNGEAGQPVAAPTCTRNTHASDKGTGHDE
jgi:hypothetical protein